MSYICICNSITDSDLRDAEANGARTHDEVFAHFGTAPQCGCCIDTLCDKMGCNCACDNRARAA